MSPILLSVTISAGATVLLAAAILFGARWLNRQSAERHKRFATFIWAHQGYRIIDQLTAAKARMERETYNEEIWYFEIINNDIELERIVVDLLNQYNNMAAAVEADLADLETLTLIRGPAIVEAWDQFNLYISDFRLKNQRPNAWKNFEALAKKIRASSSN